ncbi:putative SAM-dependent methyltransferase [Cladorrhinum samala]|uniref:Sterol 24-C-methyltransferase n=1 Tax=Cladorrhinum samala TaxID=585594 RepID=A0AAV9HE43_9PEZI|nr:putative SAM-dependent methyltransferase [Cladorrhinum samala]
MPHDYNPEYLRRYLKYWNRAGTSLDVIDHEGVARATEAERKERQKHFSIIAIYYYDLVAPLYERGWGQRFHYTPQTPGLSLYDSFTKYEQTFAHIARLKEGMKVLDLGCGVGGPARTICQETGCDIIGITNNDWLVARGTELNKKHGLDHKIKLQVAEFTSLPFPDNHFDAAYSIEALCYAPDQAEAYREIFRVLKPGAPFTNHDWCMTDRFDEEGNREHRRVRNLIEFGNGLSKMPTVSEIRKGIKDGGLEILSEEDMAFRSSPVPWYYGPGGDVLSAWKVPGWADFAKVFQMSEPFLFCVRIVQRVMIFWGLLPPEVATLMDFMWYCCRSVVWGGQLGIFTPMYVFSCRKPFGSNQ